VSPVDRYLFSPIDRVRPWLLYRGLLLLLAFDLWIDLVSHGGRYGVGGFNVAHFGWLDAVQPHPSADLYVGVLLLSGLLAFTLALVRPVRWALGLLAALYTWSWAMSMLDSYQHHYLLSLLLLSLTFFPRLTAADVFPGDELDPHKDGDEPQATDAGGTKRARRRQQKRKKNKVAQATERARFRFFGPWTSAWGYVSFGITGGLVYGFTAVTKMEADWREGHALRRLTSRNEPVLAVRDRFVEWGMEPSSFWELFATSAIALQVVIGAGYLLAARRDARPSKARSAFFFLSLAAALSFHVGAELLELRIGWFSYYMLYVPLVFFLPRRALRRVAFVATAPVRRLSRAWTPEEGRGVVAAMGIAAGGIVALIGYLVDLPGGLGAGASAGALLGGATVVAAVRGRAARAQPYVVAGALASLAMWAAIASTDVRFDYYRRVGGDMRRRGELEEALDAYIKANRYAPEDDDRKDKERELRQRLGRLE
jgi:hypothetical protein